MSITIKQVEKCSKKVIESVDPKTTHVVYVDRKPTDELTWSDGAWWWRRFDGGINAPFYRAGKTLAEVREWADYYGN